MKERSYGGYTLAELKEFCGRKRNTAAMGGGVLYTNAAVAALPFLIARIDQLIELADTNEYLEVEDGKES